MDLREIEATLPPGFRFHPSDEELVCYYLYKKIANEKVSKGTMVEVNLHTCEPWQLPGGCRGGNLMQVASSAPYAAKLGKNEWYFFSFRERKYPTGVHSNRATASGYWKATGKDRPIVDPHTNGVVGVRKTLVFYRDRAPNGIKTSWAMHEFRLETPSMPPKEDWVLCRVIHKTNEEVITTVSLQNQIEKSNISSSCPKCTTSHVHQTITNGYQCNISFSEGRPLNQEENLSTLSNYLAMLNPDFVEFPLEKTNTMSPFTELTPNGEDEYSFLLEMSSEDAWWRTKGL